MKKLILIIFILLIILFGFLLKKDLKIFFLNIQNKLIDFKDEIDFSIDEVKKSINTPEPLRVNTDLGIKGVKIPDLVKEGIIEWTNKKREEYDLRKLDENEILNQMAKEKAEDILEKQYFAHISPSNEGVQELAGEFNYEFISVGENLAMGIFKDEGGLVGAWMESEGHRENILGDYTQIGVGLKKGVFKGKEVWIAVQHFGVPRSFCDEPSTNLKEQIKNNKEQIESLSSQIEEIKKHLENSEEKPKNYNALVRKYNNLVSNFNLMIKKTKDMAREYNLQVKEFNDCLNNLGAQ